MNSILKVTLPKEIFHLPLIKGPLNSIATLIMLLKLPLVLLNYMPYKGCVCVSNLHEC